MRWASFILVFLQCFDRFVILKRGPLRKIQLIHIWPSDKRRLDFKRSFDAGMSRSLLKM